jgi:hypothetical protein
MKRKHVVKQVPVQEVPPATEEKSKPETNVQEVIATSNRASPQKPAQVQNSSR